jgi:hypothetical protein
MVVVAETSFSRERGGTRVEAKVKARQLTAHMVKVHLPTKPITDQAELDQDMAPLKAMRLKRRGCCPRRSKRILRLIRLKTRFGMLSYARHVTRSANQLPSNERIDTVKSTDRSLNLLQNSLAIGRETVERLDRQGESLHNTKRNLELANNKSKQAADKTRDLKRLDKSIFNPRSYVTVKPSARDREDEIRENSRSALRKQNASRSDAANRSGGMQTKTAASAADRAKYLLEPVCTSNDCPHLSDCVRSRMLSFVNHDPSYRPPKTKQTKNKSKPMWRT